MIDSFDAKAIHHKLERLRRKGKIGARREEIIEAVAFNERRYVHNL
jgi:hypothetical protein